MQIRLLRLGVIAITSISLLGETLEAFRPTPHTISEGSVTHTFEERTTRAHLWPIPPFVNTSRKYSESNPNGSYPASGENSTQRPNVQLDYGNFIGGLQDGIESFTGIPYAEPPVGDLRLRNPVPPRRTYPNFDATVIPPGCPQKWPVAGRRLLGKLLTEFRINSRETPLFGPLAVGQEDCLTIDIRRPARLKEGADLPVMVYIYGGAGEFGATNIYSGVSLVSRSVQQNMPILYAAMNYRLSAFGSLGGKQVAADGVGNLALKDQRLALKWIQKYIRAFGGDPSKVTIFGESAGAISVSYQLLAYNGNHEGLFRAAICQSGTALPTTKLSEGGGQSEYDELVRNTGCAGREDSLQCLRQVDFDTFFRALSQIEGPLEMQGALFRWGPRIDGEIITDTLYGSLSKGNFAKVPVITGVLDDEGTLLTVGLLPIITERRMNDYLSNVFFQNASATEIREVMRLYPDDPRAGSPYNTGFSNVLTPVFKRVASLFGDCLFQAPRRQFLKMTQAHMPVWTYLDKGLKGLPFLGACHGTDLPYVFGLVPGARTDDYQSRWIAFATTLNPNIAPLPEWTNYGVDKDMLLIGMEGSIGMVTDNYREEQMAYLNAHSTSLAMQPR